MRIALFALLVVSCTCFVFASPLPQAQHGDINDVKGIEARILDSASGATVSVASTRDIEPVGWNGVGLGYVVLFFFLGHPEMLR